MTKIFDTHAHLLDDSFDEDRDALIKGLDVAGVELVMECSTDGDDMIKAAELAEKYDNIYAAVGVHPHSASEYDDVIRERIKELCKGKKVMAIGEIGLDYHYDFSPRDVQKKVFEDQLMLAEELGMPVVLHSREATEDMLEILGRHKGIKGVMHCFSGSAEVAKIVLDLGLHIGFGGSLTFKNAK